MNKFTPDFGGTLLQDSRELANKLLAAELPNRWLHVQGVAKRAILFDPLKADTTLLAAAGIVHDIGYAEALAETGLHQLDGALHLRSLGFPEELVNLVAHHTCAHIAAELAGKKEFMKEKFPLNPSLPHTHLCFCDMTTSPVGNHVTVEERLEEIRERHNHKGPVVAYHDIADPLIFQMCEEAKQDLLLPGVSTASQNS